MSKEFLVGNTGFVGSNLAAKHRFDGLFHSTNISDSFSQNPDLLIYAGVRAEMFLANKDPKADRVLIEKAIENIKKINPHTIVLISTVAVYPIPQKVNEDTPISVSDLSAYGANRFFLEEWVEKNITSHLIIRLPAIFGINLKKNFLYDYIHFIPSLLTKSKFLELSEKEMLLKSYYFTEENNGFYKCRNLNKQQQQELKDCFKRLGFSALNFTDTRSVYQFYYLEHLWEHINFALENGIRKLNLVTSPIQVGDLFYMLEQKEFHNELDKLPFNYDVRTKHSKLFGREDGYIMDRSKVLRDIQNFIDIENKL